MLTLLSLPNILAALMRFFTSPAGKYVMVILAFVAWTGYMRHDASKKATKACQSEQFQKEVNALREQLGVANRVATANKNRADEAEILTNNIMQQRDALLAEIKAAEDRVDDSDNTDQKCDPSAGRVLPDDIRKRLLDFGRIE